MHKRGAQVWRKGKVLPPEACVCMYNPLTRSCIYHPPTHARAHTHTHTHTHTHKHRVLGGSRPASLVDQGEQAHQESASSLGFRARLNLLNRFSKFIKFVVNVRPSSSPGLIRHKHTYNLNIHTTRPHDAYNKIYIIPSSNRSRSHDPHNKIERRTP